EVARAGKQAGGVPRRLLGPTHLNPPDGIETSRGRSAADMHREVVAGLAWADGLVMTAAVADYTPAEPLTAKLKKSDGDLVLRLKRTVDILADVKTRPERAGMVVVGFSLDVDMNLDEGRRKLREKNLDLIVVNTVSSFGSGRETAAILSRDGGRELGDIDKSALATHLVAMMGSLLHRE
ncbi:MAG: bifunctional 4'-phosphopantothenoylcysteine decarboxylase/phosphopantothenoylcysteine synthetase, partial [Planctomycetes bacterium]|nr:bifunctional 4'-phosphopantothenoylcysteine decarboxylase/phosphopantothenoylcysteine synthetase [Planctomycetota bacterium]